MMKRKEENDLYQTVDLHALSRFVQSKSNTNSLLHISMGGNTTAIKSIGRRGKPRSKAVSKSSKGGLQFPIGRVPRFQRKGRYAEQVKSGSPVYLSAELLELAGNALFLGEKICRRSVQSAKI